jgi:hypothetical protein
MGCASLAWRIRNQTLELACWTGQAFAVGTFVASHTGAIADVKTARIKSYFVNRTDITMCHRTV